MSLTLTIKIKKMTTSQRSSSKYFSQKLPSLATTRWIEGPRIWIVGKTETMGVKPFLRCSRKVPQGRIVASSTCSSKILKWLPLVKKDLWAPLQLKRRWAEPTASMKGLITFILADKIIRNIKNSKNNRRTTRLVAAGGLITQRLTTKRMSTQMEVLMRKKTRMLSQKIFIHSI